MSSIVGWGREQRGYAGEGRRSCGRGGSSEQIADETSGIVGDDSDSDSLKEEETADESEGDNSGANEEPEQPGEGEQVPDENGSDTPVTDEATNEQTPHRSDGNANTNQPEVHDASTEQLPETGPAGVLAASLLLGGIVGVTLAYIRSRA